MILDLAERLRSEIKGHVRIDEPLAPLTTYRLGGPAALFVHPEDDEDLQILSSALRDAEEIPVLVVGRGSNMVVSDGGFPGVCVRLGRRYQRIGAWDPPDGPVASGAEAGGATTLPLLANWTVRRGLEGFEWAVGVPGSVGGGVRMNAGAHGAEVKDTLARAAVWNLRGGDAPRSVPADELGLSYRTSGLSDDELVVSAWFAFQEEDIESVRAKAESYRMHRAETQPGAAQNAGSVFKNPPGDHAGRLVEAAGLKGFSVGGAQVSQIHANFFIAPEGTTSQDVYDLVEAVRDRVRVASGVELETEIRFVGTFEDPALAEVRE